MVALSTAQHQLLDPSQHIFTATDQQVVQTLSDFLPNRIIDIHTHLYSLTDSQKTQRQASIIMLGSMYGSVGSYPDAYEGVSPASPVAYHTLKGGILQMTRHLAVYWASKGVRVNSLSPGPFPAPSAPRGMVQRLEKKSPMKRMGKPDELKGAVVFLASQASSYMTGQNLVIDGGWTAW